jgi:hypothetical protein
MTAEELAAATVTQIAETAVSPFWRGGVRESGPAAPAFPVAVTEAEIADQLARLDDSDLAAVFDARTRRSDFESPIWR